MASGIVVATCVEVGLIAVEELQHRGIEVDGILTIPPDVAVRAGVSGYVDFTERSGELGVDVLQVPDYALKDERVVEIVAERKGRLLVVCGWQRLVPPRVLGLFERGAVGFHGSAERLPRGRGRSPVNWSLIEGRDQFILHMFFLDPATDAGDVIDTETFDLNVWDTCRTVYYKIGLTAAMLVARNVEHMLAGVAVATAQVGQPSYFPKRTPEDGLIRWTSGAASIANLIRAVTRPYPGAFGRMGGVRVLIWAGQLFDTRLRFEAAKPGTVIATFPNGDFLVATGDHPLLVTDYEPRRAGLVRRGATFDAV